MRLGERQTDGTLAATHLDDDHHVPGRADPLPAALLRRLRLGPRLVVSERRMKDEG